MAVTNFILTVAAVGAAFVLLRGDVKQSATIFRRNVRHIRNWLEEESASASNSILGQLLIAASHLLSKAASTGGFLTGRSNPKPSLKDTSMEKPKLDSHVTKKEIPKEKH